MTIIAESLKPDIGARIYYRAYQFCQREGVPFQSYFPYHAVFGLNSECSNTTLVLIDKYKGLQATSKGGMPNALYLSYKDAEEYVQRNKGSCIVQN